MISFDLCCGKGHRFEGWFSSSGDFDSQQSAGLVTCPLCDDTSVRKMLSVPNVGRKGNQPTPSSHPSVTETAIAGNQAVGEQITNIPISPPALAAMMEKIATAQTAMLKDSTWVGRKFAETARAIHYGESDDRLIHGEASRQEAEALAEEGVAVAPLLIPFIPPEAKN